MTLPTHADLEAALSSLKPPTPALPPGAWDAHAHVFGPWERFPIVPESSYRPPLAPFEQYVDMLDRVGFHRGVIVHASANGFDNSGMLDALNRAGGRLRGVAVPPLGISDDELAAMKDAGVRGVRFSAVRPVPPGTPGVLGLDDLAVFAPRLKELGWHAQVWARTDLIAERQNLLRSVGVPLVFDHMGQFHVEGGPGDAGFQTLLSFLRDGLAWIKTTAFRNSRTLPEMDDVKPFHALLTRTAPDRLLWGSDWPFIGMAGREPQIQHLLEQLRRWTGDERTVEKILLDNPTALYGP